MNYQHQFRRLRRRSCWSLRNVRDKVDLLRLRNSRLPTYWSYSDNFGEWITAAILKSKGIYPQYTESSDAKLVSTGSILENVPEDYAGIILGSGFIDGNSSRKFERADIWAVRGRLSAERAGCEGVEDVVYGDPGLLASYLVPSKPSKRRYKLGIVPHYKDYHLRYDDSPIGILLRGNRGSCTVIDVQQSPVRVIKEISQCEFILSSSLHGLIVADSLGIPNRWIEFSTLVGGRFKFHDYYSSLDIKCDPLCQLDGSEGMKDLLKETYLKPQSAVDDAKRDLWTLFGSIKPIFVGDNK